MQRTLAKYLIYFFGTIILFVFFAGLYRFHSYIGKSTQIDPLRPKQTNPPRPFQTDPLIPA